MLVEVFDSLDELLNKHPRLEKELREKGYRVFREFVSDITTMMSVRVDGDIVFYSDYGDIDYVLAYEGYVPTTYDASKGYSWFDRRAEAWRLAEEVMRKYVPFRCILCRELPSSVKISERLLLVGEPNDGVEDALYRAWVESVASAWYYIRTWEDPPKPVLRTVIRWKPGVKVKLVLDAVDNIYELPWDILEKSLRG